MGLLIQTQVRLVRSSFALWTVLGVLLGTFAPPRAPGELLGTFEGLFLSFLAAALGQRLFALEATGGQGTYLRALPISGSRLFALKLAVGAAALVGSAAVMAACAKLGLSRLWSTSNVLNARAEWIGFWPVLEWSLTVFAATVFLANTYERVAASRQAGLAAWLFVSLGLRGLDEVFGLGPWVVHVLSLAAAVFGLGAARAAFGVRGVGAASEQELVLGDVRPLAHALWTVPAQLLLVVLPLFVMAAHLPRDVAPYVGLPAWVLGAALCVAVGVLLVPWSLRQLRAHAPGPLAPLVLLLNLTGVGAVLWRAVRRRGPVARCSACARRRLVSLERCPSCGARGTTSVERESWRGLRLPCTPYGIAVLLFLSGGLWVFGLGGFRGFHGWELVAGDPDAWIVRNGEVLGQGRVVGYRLGGFQSWSAPFVGSRGSQQAQLHDEPHAELSVAEMEQLLLAQSGATPELARGARQLRVAFAPDDRFALRVGDELTVVGWLNHEVEFSAGYTTQVLKLYPECPAVDERVTVLASALAEGPLPRERVLALGDTTDVFLRRFLARQYLVRTRYENLEGGRGYRPVRSKQSARSNPLARATVDVLLDERYGLARADGATVTAIWAELDERASRLEPIGWDGMQALLERRKLFYPQLRSLARLGDAGRATLLARVRAGDVQAALVAGWMEPERGAADPALLLALEHRLAVAPVGRWSDVLFFHALPVEPEFVALGSALLELAPARAAEFLLARWESTPVPELMPLLAVCGDARVPEVMATWLARTDDELAERLGVQKRTAVNAFRRLLEAVRLGHEWGLVPEDLWGNNVLYVLSETVKAAKT